MAALCGNMLMAEHKQRLGVSTKNRINVSGFESVCRLIEAGVGIGIVPESVIERHRHTMAIVAVPLDSDPSAVRERSVILKEPGRPHPGEPGAD